MDLGIRVLGPVELRGAGPGERLGSAKERLVLAALALDAGRPVSLDTLIHRLWDDAPPAKPRASVHAYAARIRRRLRAAHDGELLLQQAHTYTLALHPRHVDCHRFAELADRARVLTDGGGDAEALGLLREAEELWRGEPLAGLPGLWAERVRAGLEEKHLAAHLTRFGIELRRGHFAELVPEVGALLEQYPSDETLACQLMTAAYGCGRQSDALRVYDTVRRRLREQLGTDPGDALTRLHRLVLNGAPLHELLPPPEPAVAAPRTLPSHPELVGREHELAAILSAAPAQAAPGAVITLQAVSGMAGVGKSLLAVHAARHLGGRYPDGQIHLDLRAHSPGQEPLAPEAALRALLRVLGVPARAIPDTLDELVSLWRTLLSTRRAVIVLDDAAGPEQLRPLLPGASPSLVIITSRRRITGLPGVRPVLLDVLPPDDAAALFRRLAGHERTGRAHEVADIVRLSGYLPLAIELAAGRLASRPAWTTANLLHRLTHGHGRLAEIRDGSREMVRAFEVSYMTLTTEERAVFRRLGLQLGPDFETFTTAALTGLPARRAERVLESLLDAHLIQEPKPERYVFHDLLGEYARTLSLSEDPADERDGALRGLIDFYVQASDAADRLVYPRRARPDLPRPARGRATPAWPGPDAARHWLTAERPGLIAAERHCRTEGATQDAALLAGALANFLDEEGYSAEAQRMHESAARHWRAVHRPDAEARALLDLGSALSRCGRYDEAFTAVRRARQVADRLRDSAVQAEALHLLGLLHWNLGRLPKALALQNEALALRLPTEDAWQIARCRNNLGITLLYLGDFRLAEDHFHAALAGFRTAGDELMRARVLNNCADLKTAVGDQESARKLLTAALEIFTELSSPSARAITQVNLANTMDSPAELNRMLDLYRDSLATFRRLGDRRNASITLHGIGLALHAADQFLEAAAQHRHALDLARSIGAAHEEAQALHGIGAAEQHLGQYAAAAAHFAEAIATAERTGSEPEAARARASLDALRAQNSAREGSGAQQR
ncbi:AfsR/SARP family transcriptional regulator [Streptomyces spectabilis]|uniref:DNA-binding SARP family transcriptional activator/tetratricopeptide (TPR) repeat protein n=1 Tax=Streptomyces spectabilis TaxID=68270 RepID=A0A5P2XF31_STRST|nr:BTAD domain-containing putative transcriptional regulator [Streptomyces spectabilis]MBB5107181.1 DNA-binding SARP family transcriptional activator/tetratricopeptide (TPR) repeat protein [Streptomyces spectabilis]MCI3906227.1 tetratricopeptide repeat protein [Streptomyces spectabilis]QEV63101.1 transcriptional regulator [Streptomyces spectabilis]GGV04032.1 SARP family transcriptional regulator [Streptomyces spectabilis]